MDNKTNIKNKNKIATSTTSTTKNSDNSIAEKYKKLTDHEHVLKKPGMYIGGTDTVSTSMWIFDEEAKIFKKKDIQYIPGLYKIFDEIIVNARDHIIRNPKTCSEIKVVIDQKEGIISVTNDGPGIEVVIHPIEKVYIPEMILGQLRTSSNYDDDEKRIVGGTNGYGAKLVNIFSEIFIIETIDSTQKKYYKQVFKDNMYTRGEPEIVKSTDKSYTCITFKPDYSKFKQKGLSIDMANLFKKRVYDLAGCTPKKIKVSLNGKVLPINSFLDYIKLYYESTPESLQFVEINDRWKIGLVFDSINGFNQISFVNGILTYEGGTHVKYITDMVSEQLMEIIQKKKKGIKVKSDQIKSNITLFLDSCIENPGFNSQVKEKLTTKVSDFGSRCEFPKDFITKFSKCGIIDEIISLVEFRENKELIKTDGKKITKLRDIAKLDDATKAGSAEAHKCRLILTEGDSAKTFALHGLSVIGNEFYGVFPLKGKPLNVREATVKQIVDNEEFINIKKILGLKQGKEYKDVKELRYGGILILTDQDVDGSHIKGLLINMIQFMWPTLILRDDFIQCLRTPLIITHKKSDTKHSDPMIFYTSSEYNTWRDEMGTEISKWDDAKYYKGLGTSTAYEAKRTFLDFHSKQINFVCGNVDVKNDINNDSDKDSDIDDLESLYETDEGTENENNENNGKTKKKVKKYKYTKQEVAKLKKVNEIITLAFDKKRADDRKKWLSKYDQNSVLETNGDITFDDFFNKDMIHFSNADNIRSIPSLIDGLKPSQRKILFASFKRGKNAKEIKVSQFAGYVSNETEYHHGEASLMGAIINMAQNYPGSNNINFLMPNGEFGTRRQLGKDAASPRYIFTNTNKLAYKIFREEDLPILEYCVEEGRKVEPKNYEPIFPTILVNGTDGIGTGYSTYIPCFDPKDIVNSLRTFIEEKNYNDIHPKYQGFIGQITRDQELKYIMKGSYEIIDDETVHITELPIFMSFEKYREYLISIELLDKKEQSDKKLIVDFEQKPFPNKVDILIKFKPTELQKLIKNGELEKYLKLSSSISLANMTLFNADNKIIKFDSVYDIIEDFYIHRKEIYVKRKAYNTKVLENDMNIIKYKVKFIEGILSKEILIERQKKDKIISRLVELKFPKLARSIDNPDVSYSYLTDLPLWTLTYEKIEELKKELEDTRRILEEYKKLTINDIWLNELDEFMEAYEKWVKEWEEEKERENSFEKKKLKTKSNKKTTKTTKPTKTT
jgi:DNA topoisomerase-2